MNLRGEFRTYGSRLLFASMSAMVATMAVTPAYAQEAVRSFNVPAQPLAKALLEFGRQARVSIAASAEITRGHTSMAVNGAMTTRAALDQLLRGSGLTFAFVGSDAVRISVAPQSAASAAPVAVEAAASGPSDGASQPGDIVVTASKRVQTLQNVSSSIAALNGEDLREKGTNSFADYLNSVPSVSLFQQGPGISTLVIRGITTGAARNDEPQNKETVGVYIDETPISVNGFNPDLGLYDLQRIEVLRGPQGTLYGSGSMGGTIRIITNRPDPTRVAGMFDATLSDTNHGGLNYDLKGMLNVPLVTDRLALRGIFYRSDYDGYIDNTLTGRNNENTARTTGGRIQLGAKLSDAINANITYMIHDLRTGGRSEQTGPYQRAVAAFDGLNDRNNIGNLTINADLGGPTLTSSTSYFTQNTVNRNTLEFVLAAALGFKTNAALIDTTKVHEFSQEVRLASPDDGRRFSYVLGGFYQNRWRSYSENGPTPGIDAFVGLPSTALGTPDDNNIYYSTQHIRQDQLAVFGELSYKLGAHVTATAGGRYFHYIERFDTAASGLLNGGVTQSAGRLKENGFTPKFNLSYKTDSGSLIYAEAAKGFRLGGVNSAIPANLCAPDLATLGTPAGTFKSDTVWNYEVGTKNRFFDRRLTLNASAYMVDWHDVQTTLLLPSCSSSFRTNAGTARSMGVELESSLRLGSFTLDANFGYDNSELRQDVPLTPWRKGDRVPGVPRFQASGGLRYGFKMFADANAFGRVNVRYIGHMNSLFDAGDVGNRVYGGYTLIDLRVGTDLPHLPVNISLFADNLFNSAGRVAATAARASYPENYIIVRPRTIGVTLHSAF